MHIRMNTLAVAIAALVLAPLACAVPRVAPTTAVTQASPANQTTIPALGLSYRGQYLAWIAAHGGKTELMLASWSGKNVHAVPIPGGCAETGLRWARKWNTLAVLTQCPANASDPHAAHGALWVVDVGLKQAVPRKVTDIQGTASDPQWRTDDKVIAFLYVPDGASLQGIAAVPATGGTPQRTTPAGWNVHDYRLLPQNGGVMYTANAGGSPQNQAPTLYLQTGRVPQVLFDPVTAKGALHGLRVSLLGLSGGSPTFVKFLGRRPGATGSHLYTLLPGHDKHAEPMMGPGQIAWYTSQDFNRVFTIRVDGGVRVSDGYPFTAAGAISDGSYSFTVPGTISAGRRPFSVAVPHRDDFLHAAWGTHATSDGYGGGGASIAFVQTQPGRPPAIRAGRFSAHAPPIVWPASAKVAMLAH